MAYKEQYAFRAQKSLGLVYGTPSYTPTDGFQPPDETARTYKYSLDGKLFAIALPKCVRVVSADNGSIVRELLIENAIDLGFSPKATYISTYERYVKPTEENVQHRNHRVWHIESGEEVIGFPQKSMDGWDLQYIPSEEKAVRLINSEVHVYSPADWSKGVVDKLRIEGLASIAPSGGTYPSLAVFVGEKNSSPAKITMYNLAALSLPPSCSKSFYKADKCVMKWNSAGTQVLALTSTDVDKSNKNYYGESNLYLLSAAGNFDCRVNLDKEGPIHDFNWSPNSKEFGVVYGFMPAKTVLFDQRVKIIHDFGIQPRNFISFNPQGRLVALAGFGNLAGKIEVYDRRTLSKVCEIDAPNTSWCEWSPDGRSLLTATLSPRLRVDNGIKVWHCTGALLHVHMIEELYQVCWRPAPIDVAPPFGNNLPTAPPPSASVEAYNTEKPTPVKAAGAYRPPGARGTSTPSIFKREDEGGFATPNGSNTPRNGSTTNLSLRDAPRQGSPAPPGGIRVNGITERGMRARVVPGAAPPVEEPKVGSRRSRKQEKEKEKEDGAGSSSLQINPARANVKRSSAGVASGGSKSSKPTPQSVSGPMAPPPESPSNRGPISPMSPPPPSTVADATTNAATGEPLDPAQKKIRNLTKKLKAIDELKEKSKRGEKMEATQLKKIELEGEIRKELAALQASLST